MKKDLIFSILISSLLLIISSLFLNQIEIPNYTNLILQTEDNQDQSEPEIVKVTRVIDGDTIELESGQKVRYIGIDAPENYTFKKEECFAKEAKQKNKELVLNKTVKLIKDKSETDRYGRLLRYVYIEANNQMVNEIMVRDGFAKSVGYPPDTLHKTMLDILESQARELHLGIWGDQCLYNSSLSF